MKYPHPVFSRLQSWGNITSLKLKLIMSFPFSFRSFVCLSDREQDRVPSTAQKLRLKSNGLSEKKILLPITADAESVKSVLYE